MRSTSKSSTLKRAMAADFDGNAHDAVVTGSINTRESGYDCRCTLLYPYETTDGSAQDAVIKRASISVSHYIPFNSQDPATQLLSFFAVAKRMDLIDNLEFNMDSADLWAELTADFSKMITDIVTVQGTNVTRKDPETAFITTNSPALVAGN